MTLDAIVDQLARHAACDARRIRLTHRQLREGKHRGTAAARLRRTIEQAAVEAYRHYWPTYPVGVSISYGVDLARYALRKVAQ